MKSNSEIKSVEYVGETLQQTYNFTYSVHTEEDYQQDLDVTCKGIEYPFEVKRCNDYYYSTSGEVNPKWEVSQTSDKVRFDVPDFTNITTTANFYTYVEKEKEIPENLNGKYIYKTILQCNKNGVANSKYCKARKMIDGHWGLAVVFRDGILLYSPATFRKSILGNCVEYGRYTQQKTANYYCDNTFWQLRLMLDLEGGKFLKKSVPSDIF